MTPELVYSYLKKLIIFLVGISIVLIGCILFFSPFPAIIIIPLGLALLATEFIWAKKLLKKFRETVLTVSNSAKNIFKDKF